MVYLSNSGKKITVTVASTASLSSPVPNMVFMKFCRFLLVIVYCIVHVMFDFAVFQFTLVLYGKTRINDILITAEFI